jgi:hypothetical protein
MFCNYYCKETKDISEVEQIAFVRYYVDGVIYDRFLGFHIMDASSHFHYTGCPKNGVLTVHYGVEETTVNVRKMFKKFYWT